MNFEISKNELIRETSLADCDLSVRAYNSLRFLNIDTLEKLASYSEEELKNFSKGDEYLTPLLSNKTIKEIKELLDKHNLTLKKSTN